MPHVPMGLLSCACTDAGADLKNWVSGISDYGFVQLAANSSNLEAALQLVEAGGDWQLPKAQRVIGNGLRYAPDILCAKMPHLKVSQH